ncbi:MAG: FAD-dependent oxidoreductase [Bacteroidaceae bacterium]|nr:FAD-dependent oxidoreductase [Bacteroidaceae bacterium]
MKRQGFFCTFLLMAMCAMTYQDVRADEAQGTVKDVDICIYGSTPAGIMAAYTAKLKGKSVLLVSPTKRIGGMTAGGLGWTDIGDSTSHRRIIKGFAREFYRRIGQHYGMASPTFYFEPKVALATFKGFLSEVGLKDSTDIWYEWRIVSAEKEGNEVKSITLEKAPSPIPTPQEEGGSAAESLSSSGSGERFGEGAGLRSVRARIFMDCSYEGDLMARAGITYTVGRESKNKYGEPENGAQCLNKHQFCDGVDPYVVPGDPSSGLLWGIMSDPMPANGTGDNHIQAYNYRLTLTKTKPFRSITAQVPDNYDPSRYELLFRWMEKKGWSGYGDCIKWTYMKDTSGPNSWNAYKTDNNNNGAFSTDMIGYSWDYPEATYEQRDSIAKLHEDYTKGLLYILWTDPRVPKNIRDEFNLWGYPLDEYEDNGNFTPQLYIRAARRMIGRMVMTEDYCLKNKEANDPIAWGAYTMDSHNCGRYVVNGQVKNEGDVQRHLTKGPYNISYRAVTPLESEARNVIVPVCLSASHIAYGSIRMEPVYMVLGETTALAAIQAIDEHDGCVQAVDPSRCIAQLENGLDIDTPVPDASLSGGASVSVDITRRVLANPSFEESFTNTTQPPTGWQESPAGTTLQRSMNKTAKNRDGQQAYVCKPATNSTINKPLHLYQQIPAEKLGAGIYKVSCRMWVEKDFYGTACLFAAPSPIPSPEEEGSSAAESLSSGERFGQGAVVQYWTNEPYYRNGTSGYDNLTYTDYRTTFARHAGGFNSSTAQNMQRMVVYITLQDGDDLQLGIRTNSANQGSDKNGAGYFMVDDFHVEKVAEQPLSQDEFCDKVLTNYDFEKNPQGVTYDWNVKTTINEAANGPIYGWQSNAWTDNYGGVSDGTNLEWKWAGYVASTSGVIPNDFRLYQTIPADRLTPGIYEVNARMWQYASKLGITRLYGQAGEKCSVQYYGVESKYPHLRDSQFDYLSDETATFAGLSANTTTGRVNNMALDIEVGEGEDLELGVKSGYGLESNNAAGANHGKFYVDLVRTWKVSDLPVTYDENASDNLILPHAYNNKVVLNKTFTNGEWQYVCLPFSLNAADVETIFGKGTEVEFLQPLGLYGGGEEEQETPNEPHPQFISVNAIEAGFPFRIRPTDALPAPIVLEHVNVSVDSPKDEYTQDASYRIDGQHSYYSIVGTFQKTDEAPAFSAILTYTDPTSIKALPQGGSGEGAWYNLGGQPASLNLKGSGGAGAILVTKGRKVQY